MKKKTKKAQNRIKVALAQKEKSNKYYTDSGSHVNVPDKNLGPKMLTIFERFLSK